MHTVQIMFEPGNLLYFNPFIFPDGGDPKPKFFVVLGEVDETVLLASLPTSKDHIPSDVEVTSGCFNLTRPDERTALKKAVPKRKYQN